ncbi:protein LUTEIN DEFICIENT 5, chloroplastic-like [Rosa chinensis]|uniref:protein LUTEIN DEFICIENT 5, chloroplastic-like n=1 Tax=Rosa chinensis TaxID=74649 RepID=UPI001AD8C81B|nr:protein LUTEIN DEFICIENT 5, chloroplastic-like [Rosa chinensis]
MAATIPLLQFVRAKTIQTNLQTNRLLRPTKQRENIGFSVITCSSSSNGRGPHSVDTDVNKSGYISTRSKNSTGKRIITSVVQNEAFFVPLYKLYHTYGGVFRLTLAPKSFLIVSDPAIAKHILRDNSKAYSKGILAEVLDFVMGKGLIPADYETWCVREPAIVPALHLKYVAAMIKLFRQATVRLCEKLDTAASNGEDVEMESLFSHLTLDIIKQ